MIRKESLGLVFACALLANSTGNASSQTAEINVLMESDLTSIAQFVDSAGDSRTVKLIRDDVGDYWSAAAPMDSQKGPVFGAVDAHLPRVSRLAGRGIDPAEALKPFSLSLGGATPEDLVIFQAYNDELVVGVVEAGLIESVHYIGSWIDIIGVPPSNHCNRFRDGCCRTVEVEVECDNPEFDGDGNPIPCFEDVPDPHLNSCLNALSDCPGVEAEVCSCLSAACFETEDHNWDVHFDACEMHLNKCTDSDGDGGNEFIDLLEELFDVLRDLAVLSDD